MAGMLDHTLLKPEATEAEIGRMCEETIRYQFASICILPAWTPYCVGFKAHGKITVCTVTGFPLGASPTNIKAAEAGQSVMDGADEIDMVINLGWMKSGHYDLVERDIRAVVRASVGRLVKVIIETCVLTDEEKIRACLLAKKAGAGFVKTSTGFHPGGGATAQDVALMRRTVGPDMGVKASAGIRTPEQAQIMVAAGANRIGTSSSLKIIGVK
ncbi:deoxyribose-phosphate aldolase [bacterium]|nr:deoxyribose-phosphate aldolase [bacterium]MBU1650912.1 deoxyribose-phosphate aldolase [bacterium]MBU1880613.1 deoxyribose-phosphate aldolase [bacterium]